MAKKVELEFKATSRFLTEIGRCRPWNDRRTRWSDEIIAGRECLPALSSMRMPMWPSSVLPLPNINPVNTHSLVHTHFWYTGGAGEWLCVKEHLDLSLYLWSALGGLLKHDYTRTTSTWSYLRLILDPLCSIPWLSDVGSLVCRHMYGTSHVHTCRMGMNFRGWLGFPSKTTDVTWLEISNNG